ncbi:hypothetical protein FHT78_005436 [Rhizobium sp. BK196]|uniref:hypothetical protein n=1 Tax=Rhizobium sp. BK196 TaxID=2587073 RepID=UPI00160EB457|nr:hypothetical protein [Rhizobium sp. BK196]MBB3313642.1 hypothetical protein [Rhizobium sp. BK196]
MTGILFGHNLGLGLASPGKGGGGPAPIVAIAPDAASAPLRAAYSVRRVKTGYAGPAMKVSTDNNTTNTDINFTDASLNSLVDDAAMATRFNLTAGATEFRTRQVYDQSGNGFHVTPGASSTGPRTQRAATGDGGSPGHRMTVNGYGLSTDPVVANSAGPFSIGNPTDVLTVIVVASIRGWGGTAFGSTQPGSVSTLCGTLLGFGQAPTTGDKSHQFLATAATDATSSSDPRYGDVCAVGDVSGGLIERSTTWNRLRTFALRFEGQKVSMFCGQTKIGEETLTVPQLTSVKVWLACNGTSAAVGNTANVEWKEYLFYQAALADAEILGIMKNCGTFFNALGDPVIPSIWNQFVLGQSLAGLFWTQAYNVANASGFSNFPTLVRAYIGHTATDDFRAVPLNPGGSNNGANGAPDINGTFYGGSAVQKAARSTTSFQNYWYEDTSLADMAGAGPDLTAAQAAVLASAHRRRPSIIFTDHGQQEALGLGADASTANGASGDPLFGTATVQKYKDGMKNTWSLMRANAGRPNAPIVMAVLAKVGGNDAGAEAVRQAQLQLAAEVPNLTLAHITYDEVLLDVVHPDDASMKRYARRLALIEANILKPGSVPYWRGPRVASAVFTSGAKTAVRVAIEYPVGCGGDDITMGAGDCGFYVKDSVGAKTVTATKESAASVLLSLNSACVGATTMQFLFGRGWDPATVPMDNAASKFPTLGVAGDGTGAVSFPLEATAPITVN